MTEATAATGTESGSRGAEIIAGFLEQSPFVVHLGMRLDRIEHDRACLSMPFRPELVTIGEVVHGGALSSLIDTAAMAAAWSGFDGTGTLRGTTVGISVDFLAAAQGREVTADAKVIKRGRSLCFCEVDVADADGRPIAKGLVTYKLG
jgi:uncharacterized protein (TIGR00369 family)